MPRRPPTRAARLPQTESAPPAGTVPAPPAPSAWRDIWTWLSALSVLPLVLHSWGAPLGEPVAEDFDFLRHNLLLGRHSLLDGGGSEAFWRPVSHQLYYWILGPLILAQPGRVAAIHVVLLALSAVLIYRALRKWWPGWQAAAAASFPFLAESVRTVVSWPSHGVELCSLLFAALALYEASRRRLATCLVALALALMSKELGVVAAVLIPLLPGQAGEDLRAWLRARAKWAVGIGLLTAAWGLAYLWVRRTAHLALPHQLESDAATLAVPVTERFLWAAGNSLRALISQPAFPAPVATQAWTGSLTLLGVAVVLLAANRAGWSRGRAALPWVAWGLAWFALSSAALTTIFPFWAPNRALFGAVGLGIALAALLGSAHGLLPWALVALRLSAFFASPGPSREVAVEAPATGAFMDFEQLTRLQRLMRDTRHVIDARFPELPRGALIGQHALPRRAEYAFGGDHALQCWYRDTTLRWVRFENYSRDPSIALTTIVEYQLGYTPRLALVEPAAMRAMLDGVSRMAAEDLSHANQLFAQAEAVQRDSAARVFLGTVTGKRAICEMGMGNRERALAEAYRSIAIYREGADPRYVVAHFAYVGGELETAAAQLDTLLATTPDDADARALRERIRAAGR